jgi:hypothetical protein
MESARTGMKIAFTGYKSMRELKQSEKSWAKFIPAFLRNAGGRNTKGIL